MVLLRRTGICLTPPRIQGRSGECFRGAMIGFAGWLRAGLPFQQEEAITLRDVHALTYEPLKFWRCRSGPSSRGLLAGGNSRMICQEWRRRVHDFPDHRLSHGEQECFLQHIHECDNCRQCHGQFEFVKQALSSKDSLYDGVCSGSYHYFLIYSLQQVDVCEDQQGL